MHLDGYNQLPYLTGQQPKGERREFYYFNDDGVLVGGLYGVRINKFFAGESMFHLSRDASKVALMALVDIMRSARMTLLDAQWPTPHLESLGGKVVPRGDYLTRLATAITP